MTAVQLVPEAPGAPVTVAATGWRLAVRRFRRNTLAVIGLVVIVAVVLFCFVGPLLYPTTRRTRSSSRRTGVRAAPTCSAPTPSGTTSSAA